MNSVLLSLRLAAPLVALSVAGSCASSRCDRVTASCPEAGGVAASVGEDFVLAPGQYAVVAPAGFVIAFELVTADSRCASDVQCVWAGDAALRLHVATNGQQTWSGELHTTTPPRQTSIGQFDLHAVSLSPAPVSTTRIEQKNYRLTLRLTQRSK